jgi:hypothetical protein
MSKLTKEQKDLQWYYNHLIIRYPNKPDERLLNLAIQYNVELDVMQRMIKEIGIDTSTT